MSVVGDAPDATEEELQEFAECVRMILRDYASNNLLLREVQFKDAEIKRAIRLATSEFNSMSPQTNQSWRHLPEAMLLIGAARWLTMSESILQLRNQVTIQTDGLGAVGIDDKYQLYSHLEARLKQEFLEKCRDYKNEQNMMDAYGSLPSGYALVNRFRR